MSEEGGTRRTTRSLARRLSTDSISPPASAATPTKRPRAARVSALSAIPETKSAKTPTTRRSRRLSTSSDVSETTEEVITKTSTPIAEKRRSRRLSIDLEEANAQRSTAVSNVPIVEVIEEEEDINILAMKEENRKSSVVDEFAVKTKQFNRRIRGKQKEVDVPVTDLDSNKLNEELVGENIAKADTSKSSKSEGVDNILKTDKECSVVIETGNVVVDVKNSSLNKEIENETPKKTIAMKQSPKTDLPEPMEIDVTDHNTSHADEDEIKNTQQTLNISYSSDSSSNVSTRSKSKVLLRISTSTDDLTKDSDASDNKKEDQDLGSAKEYNISTRSRKSVNDSVTKDLNKSAEKPN